MTLFAFSVWLIIAPIIAAQYVYATIGRSEERRVGKECL